jgi:hypothetical protein
MPAQRIHVWVVLERVADEVSLIQLHNMLVLSLTRGRRTRAGLSARPVRPPGAASAAQAQAARRRRPGAWNRPNPWPPPPRWATAG